MSPSRIWLLGALAVAASGLAPHLALSVSPSLSSSALPRMATADAPYAYWITVDRFTREHGYRQMLRYRSATRYNDGDPLPVIDSEMPNLERRLGLWRPGSPLPIPLASTKPWSKPHLKGAELWRQ